MEAHDITFRIDVFKPETLPMARLAEYLAHLSSLYGNKEKVHFKGVESGSALLKAHIEDDAYPKVMDRINSIGAGDEIKEVQKAYSQIDELLRQDNAVGEIKVGAKVIPFPGRNKALDESIVVTQWTEIDGVVIKIGGKDNSVPVTILDKEGNTYNCQIYGMDRAKELSKYFYGQTLRVGGEGKLVRHPANGWSIQSLIIKDFEPIDEMPLSAVLEKMRMVEGLGWRSEENPIQAWLSIRRH